MANEIISRSDAKAKGLVRYWTGEPCKHGHIAERQTSNGVCLTCSLEIGKRWAAAHPEEMREKYKLAARRHRRENPERIKRNRKKWELNNPEKVAERINRWKRNNPEKVAAQHKKYREANPEKVRQKNKAYKTLHKERLAPINLARVLKWREENPERARINAQIVARRRRARKLKVGGSHTREQIDQLLVQQNCKCVYCAASLEVERELDHIWPFASGLGSDNLINLQWLCPPCNRKKLHKHPIDWLCEIGKLVMSDADRIAKISELDSFVTEHERLAAYHEFVAANVNHTVIVGVDQGEPGGDWTAEAEFTRLDDGTLQLDALHRYRETIDLKPNLNGEK